MPRFFFDLQFEQDGFGVELADDAAARRVAMRYAGEVVRDLAREACPPAYWRMDVRGSAGPILFSLVLDVVDAPRPAARPLPADAPERHCGGDREWHLV